MSSFLLVFCSTLFPFINLNIFSIHPLHSFIKGNRVEQTKLVFQYLLKMLNTRRDEDKTYLSLEIMLKFSLLFFAIFRTLFSILAFPQLTPSRTSHIFQKIVQFFKWLTNSNSSSLFDSEFKIMPSLPILGTNFITNLFLFCFLAWISLTESSLFP